MTDFTEILYIAQHDLDGFLLITGNYAKMRDFKEGVDTADDINNKETDIKYWKLKGVGSYEEIVFT